MPSNDEVVLGIPDVYCPTCGATFDTSRNRIDKFSKQQRKRMTSGDSCNATSLGYSPDPFPTGEDVPSEEPEKNFVVLSCNNLHCAQYNKFKVMKIPRIYAPSAKVDLND